MIFFYNKITKNIIGIISGRVHPEGVLNTTIKLSDTKDEDIGKFVVPYKDTFQEVEEPVYELRLTNKSSGTVERVEVGKSIKKVPDGMVPDVYFAEIINKFEENTSLTNEYKVKLDRSGQLIGFEKNLLT